MLETPLSPGALDMLDQLVESCVSDLEDSDNDWDEGRLMAEFCDGVSWWVLAARAGEFVGGALPSRQTKSLAKRLRNSLEPAPLRMRINFDRSGAGVVEVGFTEASGRPGWVWPDEPGYSGPSPRRVPIVRKPHFHLYQPVELVEVAPVSESLNRIQAWLESSAQEMAAMLNPAASAADIEILEQELGVRLPPSVREAYLIHDGQSAPGSPSALLYPYSWHPLSGVAEFVASLNRAPGPRQDVQLIPIMQYGPGKPVYVESAEVEEQETPLVEWDVRESAELLCADSFGAFLEQFADGLEAGEFVYHQAQLHRVDELEEIDEDEYFEDD